MPKKTKPLAVPKTISEKTSVVFHFASGKTLQFTPDFINPFINMIIKKLGGIDEDKGPLQIKSGSSMILVNVDLIEKVEIAGAAVTTKAIAK